MIVPLEFVAFAFSVATLFCGIDIFRVRYVPRKLFRFFQGVVMAAAASYYWMALYRDLPIPTADIRVVWICLSIITCAEIISRWSLGHKK